MTGLQVIMPYCSVYHTLLPCMQIHFTNTQTLCAGTLPQDCIDRLGPLGCVVVAAIATS